MVHAERPVGPVAAAQNGELNVSAAQRYLDRFRRKSETPVSSMEPSASSSIHVGSASGLPSQTHRSTAAAVKCASKSSSFFLAGALIPGDDPSPFVRIHDEDAIHADRRLYMTATPKVYAASARNRAGELATTLCSMDDEDRYGPVLHATRFGDAVDRDLLSDYRVIVLTVPESLAAGIRIREFAECAVRWASSATARSKADSP